MGEGMKGEGWSWARQAGWKEKASGWVNTVPQVVQAVGKEGKPVSEQRAEGEAGRTWAPPPDMGLADGVRVNERWVSESWGDRTLSISR